MNEKPKKIFPIVLVEDDNYTPQSFANNFLAMFNDWNAELDEFIKNNWGKSKTEVKICLLYLK